MTANLGSIAGKVPGIVIVPEYVPMKLRLPSTSMRKSSAKTVNPHGRASAIA
jgi:hypothetical protein